MRLHSRERRELLSPMKGILVLLNSDSTEHYAYYLLRSLTAERDRDRALSAMCMYVSYCTYHSEYTCSLIVGI